MKNCYLLRNIKKKKKDIKKRLFLLTFHNVLFIITHIWNLKRPEDAQEGGRNITKCFKQYIYLVLLLVWSTQILKFENKSKNHH